MNVKFWETVSVGGDEYYTREEDAERIASYLLPPQGKVWLPFADRGRAWDKVLCARGYDVVITDSDFFETPVPRGVAWVVGNPPFSKKREVMDRISMFGLKFALILPFQWLNDSVPLDYGRQLMFFRQRMWFHTPQGDMKNPRTNCFVLSNGILRENVILVNKKE